MGNEAYCPTCQRSLYLADDDQDACPVCSSPLLESIGETERARNATSVSD